MRLLLTILLVTGGKVYTQNLIPDPFFNHVPDCQVSPVYDFFKEWYNPTSGYRNHAYHICLDNIPYSPHGVNHTKYQKKGDGMISILLQSDEFKEYKSYIATSLKSSLKKGVPYLVRFFISPKKEQNDSRNMVADAIGMYITSEKVQQDILTTLPFKPQIESKGIFFDDFNHWYVVQGKLVATGKEKHVIIGNFRSDKETNYKYTNPNSGSVPNGAYVFIDDVLIEAFNPLPDTLLYCNRQEINLNAGFHDARYQWNTGEQDSVITVNRSGKYQVMATIDTLVFYDSTQVIFMDDYFYENTIDTFLCEGLDMKIQAPVPGKYHWTSGDTSATRIITEKGIYRLTVENTCGSYQFIYHVAKIDCDCDLVFPTAFSPNGDNRNDVFTVIDQCRYRNWQLGSFHVYDKWGGKVYQETGSRVSWNGQGNNGEELPPGVYTYRLEAVVQEEHREKSVVKTGSVQLMR